MPRAAPLGETVAQLRQLNIRYALAGGLAVGAHGYIRAPTTVEFLVGEEAFEHHGALVTFRAGVPIAVDGIRIDYLSPAALGEQLEAVLDDPPTSEQIAVVLIYIKLVANRRRDQLDVIELLQAGTDLNNIRRYLERYAGDLLPTFDRLAAEAAGGH